MKERGIIFTTPMVRAILDGGKTMTRRVVKPQLAFSHSKIKHPWNTEHFLFLRDDELEELKCPYGVPGDRLYVRETFAREVDGDGTFVQCVHKADGQDLSDWVEWDTGKKGVRWKPSIHMPKKFARIWLEITSVRVERVQEIGIVGTCDCYKETGKQYRFGTTAKRKFAELWDSLNAKRGYGWDKNPWVWVIGFKVRG